MEFVTQNPVMFWSIVGVALLVIELLTLTSVAFIMAIAAFTVVALVAISGWPESFTSQLLLFVIDAAVTYFPVKMVMDRRKQNWPTTTGDIDDQIRTAPSGSVQESGLVLLESAFLGSREWTYESDETLSAGDRVAIKDVIGNKLKVVKKENN